MCSLNDGSQDLLRQSNSQENECKKFICSRYCVIPSIILGSLALTALTLAVNPGQNNPTPPTPIYQPCNDTALGANNTIIPNITWAVRAYNCGKGYCPTYQDTRPFLPARHGRKIQIDKAAMINDVRRLCNSDAYVCFVQKDCPTDPADSCGDFFDLQWRFFSEIFECCAKPDCYGPNAQNHKSKNKKNYKLRQRTQSRNEAKPHSILNRAWQKQSNNQKFRSGR